MTDKEKQEFIDTLEKTRQLFRENKLDEAQNTITALINTFTDDYPKKEDEETLYFDFKTAMEESIYRLEEKPEKKIQCAEVPVSNVYLISGSIAMQQGDFATALERMEEAMDWNPISPEIAFQYAEAVKKMGSMDQFLELTAEIFPHIYAGKQLAQAYRNIAYYYETKNEIKKAMEAFFYSQVYDEREEVKKELSELGKHLKDDEKTINLAEFPEICKKDGIPFGPDKQVVQLAYLSGRYFEENAKDPQKAYYFYTIAYGLTKDDKVKEKAAKQREKIQESKKDSEEQENK
jgi:predicted Zn-dependent protease